MVTSGAWSSVYYTGTASTGSGIQETVYVGTTTSTTLGAGYAYYTMGNETGLVERAHVPDSITSRPDISGYRDAERSRQRVLDERRAKAANAHRKAQELLLKMLDEQQRREYEENGYFHVQGQKHRYRVRALQNFNIAVVDPNNDQKIVAEMCAVPIRPMPVPDMMLAQKIWLETDEDYLLSVVNVRGR